MKVGEFLMKMIFFSGMSQKEAAEKLNIVPPNLNDIIKGKRSISYKCAKDLEKLFGIPAMVWITYQNHDELNKEFDEL